MTTKPDSTPATDPDSPVEYDVVVAGGGAAGLSAALFVARYGLETLVLTRGKSAIRQCAHLENYLGFPGGVSPERFLALGRAQAEDEGCTLLDDSASAVERADPGFAVRTLDDREIRAGHLLVATAYDGEFLEPLGVGDPDSFLPTEDGRTDIEGLYAAGWVSDETVHQAVVNAGHGARAAMSLVRDHMSERYWPAVGERYVDWVVAEGRYGGDGWDDHIDEWFDREMRPAEADVSETELDDAKADLKAEFLGRCLSEDERAAREERGQRLLLDHIDDELIAERADELRAEQ